VNLFALGINLGRLAAEASQLPLVEGAVRKERGESQHKGRKKGER